MGLQSETLLGVLGGNGYRLILITALSAASLLHWRLWRQTRSPSARANTIGAVVFLCAVALRLAFNAVAGAFDVPARLWAAPFDRLIGVTILILLGWTMVAPRQSHRHWRLFLAGGLAATALLYMGWAPLWARELLNQQPASSPSWLTRAWDGWQILLALLIARTMVRQDSPVPRPVLLAVAALAGGSLLEVTHPLSLVIPLWSRTGNLAAGFFFVAAAVGHTAQAHHARLWPPRWWEATPGRQTRPQATAAPPGASVSGQVAGRELQVEPEAVALQTVRQMASGLGAEPAIVCLVAPSGNLEGWALGNRHGTPRRLGSLAPGERPTLMRAMADRGLELASSRLARDLDQLYGLIGVSSSGPVLLEPIGQPIAVGLLIAGRKGGEWQAGDRIALQALARHAAATLATLEATTEGQGELAQVLTALEKQSLELDRLADKIDDLSRRVEQVERARPQPRPPGGSPATGLAGPLAGSRRTGSSPAPARPVPSSASQAVAVAEPEPQGMFALVGQPADQSLEQAAAGEWPGEVSVAGRPAAGQLLERSTRYEGALERLPWGVVVANARGQIVFGNQAAAQLLHTPIVPGQSLSALFPVAERVEHALRLLAGGQARVPELTFESPRLRVELEPLQDPQLGYLGAVAILHHRAAAAGIAGQLVPALADALQAPMSSILGYSDLISRSGGLTEEQVKRFLDRVDANLARMNVMLGNLLTVLELDSERARAKSEPVDVEQTIREAVERAQAQVEEKGLEVSVDIQAALPPVSANPMAVAQILDNLLANAVRRSPQGGDVLVRAQTRQDHHRGRAVLLSVHDRGPQPEAAGHAGPVGSVVEIDDWPEADVGLRVVDLLAERQGGRAWVESDPLGAHFYVRLLAADTGSESD